jgi:hypothetical protein
MMSRQPRKWKPKGKYTSLALTTGQLVLILGIIALFGVFALAIARADSGRDVPWILWGLAFGGVLFWAASRLNDMLHR